MGGGSSTVPCDENVPNDHNINLFDELFTSMREFRKDRSNCDISLNIRGSKIYAHKIILASGSPYFCHMLYGPFAERKKSEIVIEEIDFEALDNIVNYFYSGDIKISEQNVKKLFQASDRIQVDFVKNKCIGAFSQLTTPTNCFHFLEFAESVNCDTIKICVLEFVYTNFEKVIKTKEFLNLNYNQIYSITTSEMFKPKPKELYTGILSWVKHNLKDRKRHFYGLMKSIEFKNMEEGFIKTHVAIEDLMKEDHQCLLLLTETLLSRTYPEEQTFKEKWSRSLEFQSGIYVLSSVQHQFKSKSQFYNPYNETQQIKPPGIERSLGGITFQSGLIYVAGGRTKNHCMSNLCDVYNIASNEWSQRSPMTSELDLNALASHGGFIYSMGSAVAGHQRYDPTFDTWQLNSHPNLNFGEKCSADVIGNCIYVVSSRSVFGRNKSSFLNNISAYDSRTECWELLHQNPGFACDVSAVAIGNILYISHTNPNISTTFLRGLDVRSRKCIPLASMNTPRACHALIKYGDNLYAIGGKYISTVEEYDVKNNCWTYANAIKGSFAYVQAVVPDYVS